MVLASTSAFVVEQAPQNGCCKSLYPSSELQLLPASSGGLQGQHMGLIQALSGYSSALGPGAYEVLRVSCGSGDPISHSPLDLPK